MNQIREELEMAEKDRTQVAEALRILEIVRLARFESWYEDSRSWAEIDEYFARNPAPDKQP